MTRSRDSRRQAARDRERRQQRNRLILPLVGVGVVLVAAIAAIALTGGGGGSTPTTAPSTAPSAAPSVAPSGAPSGAPSASVAPSASGGAASSLPPAASAGPATATPAPIGSAALPVVTGEALPKFSPTVRPDPAVGLTIPTVDGTNFAGQPVSIALDGKPKVLLFLAHWCPHCQTEVPVIQAWLNGGGSTGDVELISIATGINPSYPNYPPDEWLAREGWTVPVIADGDGSVATAYGLSAYPYWVFVGADGTVSGRVTGELTIADLETILASMPR